MGTHESRLTPIAGTGMHPLRLTGELNHVPRGRIVDRTAHRTWGDGQAAGDLRELPRVPLRSQGYCGAGTRLSGLHWFSCNGLTAASGRPGNGGAGRATSCKRCALGPWQPGWLKKQESSRKTSISALLTMPKPLTVWITRNCGKF